MLAATPPMGWNSWNTFGAEIEAEIVKQTADAMVDSGLRDAGYEYVVIDDFWEADERVDGRLVPDPRKFPDGMKAIADYLHERGLKFGIYSCAGSHTCGGKPASYGREEIDARTFAEWEVDFLKYDFCYVPPGVDGPGLYQRMGQALRATGRPILFSACEWGANKPWLWGARVGAHMWRTTGDIADSWRSVRKIGFHWQRDLHSYAGPGRWNDPDMLVVGMKNQGNVARGGCTDAEYRSHFALWCLLASPLMIGCDVRNMDGDTARLLLNRELIAVNQDPLGRQGWQVGRMMMGSERAEVWAKPLQDGSVAAGLFNLGDSPRRLVTVAWESLGLDPHRPCRVRDLWTGEDRGRFEGSFSARVDSHDCAVIRLTPEE